MEIEVLKWVDATFHSQTWLNYLMKYITYIGEFGLAAIITACVLLAIPKTRWAGVGAAVALILDVLLVNVILKNAVNRPRPWTEFPELSEFYESCGVRLPTDSSFPSGHTAACFALAVFFVFKYKLKGLPVLAVAVLVALSRIYLCVHYPTDVLGGILIGSACGAAGYYGSVYIKKFYDKKFGNRVCKKRLSPREKIIEEMYDKELDCTGQVLKVVYSSDKTRRYVILKTEGDYITYGLETLTFDGEDYKSAYWVPSQCNGKSIYATVDEAEKQLVFEPEYIAYFKNES